MVSHPLTSHTRDRVLMSELATSNDSWGPSGTEMSEIAQMTFNK